LPPRPQPNRLARQSSRRYRIVPSTTATIQSGYARNAAGAATLRRSIETVPSPWEKEAPSLQPNRRLGKNPVPSGISTLRRRNCPPSSANRACGVRDGPSSSTRNDRRLATTQGSRARARLVVAAFGDKPASIRSSCGDSSIRGATFQLAGSPERLYLDPEGHVAAHGSSCQRCMEGRLAIPDGMKKTDLALIPT
jgi:hypothetical protein